MDNVFSVCSRKSHDEIKKRKQLVYFDHQNVNYLCLWHHYELEVACHFSDSSIGCNSTLYDQYVWLDVFWIVWGQTKKVTGVFKCTFTIKIIIGRASSVPGFLIFPIIFNFPYNFLFISKTPHSPYNFRIKRGKRLLNS